jgi:hypothetical protein
MSEILAFGKIEGTDEEQQDSLSARRSLFRYATRYGRREQTYPLSGVSALFLEA